MVLEITKRGTMAEQLSAQDWVDLGLKTLAKSGFTALKAEPLAKAMRVSRGSFYWHFADIGAFHTAVLERWREVATEQIIAAVEAGKHVFSEKPTSLELAHCQRVEEAAARRPDRKVMIGYVRRFDPHYRDAQAKIAAGLIGTPFMVRSQTADQNDPSGLFVRYAPKSGGIFLDMSVHDIDAARWFLGNPKPVRVFATGTVAVHEGLKDCGDLDNGVALCEFADGKVATFQASRTMAHGHETLTEIIGTKGRLTIGANPRMTRVEIADAHGVRNECTPTFYERFEDAFVAELNAFVEAVRHDRPLPLTLADATEATRIAIAIQASIRNKASVDL